MIAMAASQGAPSGTGTPPPAGHNRQPALDRRGQETAIGAAGIGIGLDRGRDVSTTIVENRVAIAGDQAGGGGGERRLRAGGRQLVGGQHQGLGAAAVGGGEGRRVRPLAGADPASAAKIRQAEAGDAVTAIGCVDRREQIGMIGDGQNLYGHMRPRIDPNKRGTRIVAACPLMRR